VISPTDASNGTHRFSYDKADRVITEARPGGKRLTYGYDAVGRRTSEIQRRAGATEDEQTITYRFDASGELTGYEQTGRTNSAATYTLDAAGRRASEAITYGSGPSAVSISIGHRWRKNGQREALTYPDGTTVSYAFDPANRASSVATVARNSTCSDCPLEFSTDDHAAR